VASKENIPLNGAKHNHFQKSTTIHVGKKTEAPPTPATTNDSKYKKIKPNTL
jgi:hypothetical protein